MRKIHYKGETYEADADETLLSMFLRRGIKVPWSCGGGACHFCMHRCLEGTIPEQSQATLRPVQRENGLFLLCCCVPSSDMTIELPSRTERFTQMEVTTRQQHDDGSTTLTLMPFSIVRLRPGQFLQLLAEHRKTAARIIVANEESEEIQITLSAGHGLTCEPGAIFETQGPFSQPPAGIDMEDGLGRAYPAPDPMLWEALSEGTLLREVLEVFYHRVFRDALLAPFFTQVTERRLVEKQYNFLCQAITGEKVFFGERPRNAHHWMVVSDELFDHRADILRRVLEELALPAAAREKLLAIEELYRQDIVKQAPWQRVIFGKPLPLEGFETLTLDTDFLCDNCQAEVHRGEEVTYHVRTGKVYCGACRQ